MNGERVTGALFAVVGCLAGGAVGVAGIATGHDTIAALIAATALGGMGLDQGRRVAAPHTDDDDHGEPTVAQDPTQRRIDAVLEDVSWGRITVEEGQSLIDHLRGERPAVPPAYGTKDAP